VKSVFADEAWEDYLYWQKHAVELGNQPIRLANHALEIAQLPFHY